MQESILEKIILDEIISDELMLTRQEKIKLLLIALLVGVAFDYLFYGELIGISYPIFVIIFLSSFWWSIRKKFVLTLPGGFLLGIILILSATFALNSNQVLETLNFLLIPLLTVTFTMVSTNSNYSWWRINVIGDIIKRCGPWSMAHFAKPFLMVAQEFKPKQQDPAAKAGKKILMGIMISIPILVLVIPLLSSADMVFHSYLRNFTKIGEIVNLRSLLAQSIIIFAVFVYVFAYLWSFLLQHPETGNKNMAFSFNWDPTVIITVLTVINVVYLFFSLVQFSYLYGGEGHLLPAGFTYAEYARRGFWELVAVTIINLSILLSCMKFVQKDNKTGYLWSRILLGLLIIFSLNMLFSAHFKMSLYENAYGLTYLRVFVHYFMGLLLVFFLLALGNLTVIKLHLVKSFIIVSLVFYTVLNFLGVDNLIVQHNLKMYSQTGKIDIFYIEYLSDDAVPEMINYAKNNNTTIAGHLNNYLLRRKAGVKPANTWKSFNYSRYKAQAALSKYK